MTSNDRNLIQVTLSRASRLWRKSADSLVGSISSGAPQQLNTAIAPYLPGAVLGVAPGITNGRSVYDGYQRGWGLQYGDLRKHILRDPLYVWALARSGKRTIMTEVNRMNIFLLMRFYLDRVPQGNIVEFGSYRGGNAIFMASVAQELFPKIKIYALDTYEGMPETDKTLDAHNQGDFTGVNFEELQDYAEKLNLRNIKFVKGRFEDTWDNIKAKAGKFALAHIDCDISEAVKYSYESVKTQLVDGGYIVFDDATVSSCIGATTVVEDLVIRRDHLNSEQIWPHFVFRMFDSSRAAVTHGEG